MADEDDSWLEKMGSRWFQVRRCCLKFETKPKIGEFISYFFKVNMILAWYLKEKGTCAFT